MAAFDYAPHRLCNTDVRIVSFSWGGIKDSSIPYLWHDMPFTKCRLLMFIKRFKDVLSLNRSVNERICAGSIRFPFHAHAAVDGITLRFLEGAQLDDGDGSNKVENAVDPLTDRGSSSCS